MTVTVRYDRGRAPRQLIGFGVATILMIGLLVFGVWMVIASLAQMELAGKIIGCGFGVPFALIALAALVSAAEVLTRIVRWSRQGEPLVIVDEQGVGGLGVVGGSGFAPQPISWAEISGLRLESTGARARGRGGLASLDADHRLREGVKSGLDRTAGTGLGMRDGRRSIELDLLDGRTAHRDLTLPLGPTSFARVAAEIADLARAHGVEVVMRGDLLRSP